MSHTRLVKFTADAHSVEHVRDVDIKMHGRVPAIMLIEVDGLWNLVDAALSITSCRAFFSFLFVYFVTFLTPPQVEAPPTWGHVHKLQQF